jgi:hypothetical protein
VFSVQMTLPYDERLPAFFLREAVSRLLGRVVVVRDGTIRSAVPAADPVAFAVMKLNIDGRRGVDLDRVWIKWDEDEWDDFLRFVERLPDTSGYLTFGVFDAPEGTPAFIYDFLYDAVPPLDTAKPQDGFHILRVALQTGIGDEEAARLLPAAHDPSLLESFIGVLSESFACTYAEMGTDHPSPVTEWARRRRIKFTRSVAESRTHLRGYGWTTYCPQPLLAPLGGVDALREAGVFHQVRLVPGGLVALQATATVQEYGPEAAQRVGEILAPVLIPVA